MRVSQGGHDVPSEKLKSRHPRTFANLQAAIRQLPYVLVFDNEDPGKPFRRVAVFRAGREEFMAEALPNWLRPIL